MHPSIVPLLEAMDYEVDYKPFITKEEVDLIIGLYTGLILRSKIFIGNEVLIKANKLKFIARAGAGMDQIVENEVKERNIILINAPEGNRDAVAEHALGMLLTLFNRFHSADKEVRNGWWHREENRGYELGGKTVGIIGYGNNGKAFARKLKGFDCEVLAYDILHRNYTDENAKASSMDQIFETADIISFHVPLTVETDKLVTLEYLNQFKKPIWIVNTSRGQVVVLKDLLKAIDLEIVHGAALDVLENENLNNFKSNDPETFHKLIKSNKVLLTPHVAGWTHESYFKINKVLVDKIKVLDI